MSNPFDFSPAPRKGNLADEVADALRARLASGQIAAGAQLPTGAELASAFGVSAVVIREAISRLKHDGLIETIQGSGAYVTGTRAKSFRLDGVQHTQEAQARIFELRQDIEGSVARLAAIRRSPEHLVQLRAALQAMASAIDLQERAQADRQFHLILLDAAGNQHLRDVYAVLEGHIWSTIQAARSNLTHVTELRMQAVYEHEQILHGVETQDPEMARIAAVIHIRGTARSLRLDIA